MGKFVNVIAMNSANRYLSYKEFMIKQWGEAIYRIPVDLGFGCPNRDSVGGGGAGVHCTLHSTVQCVIVTQTRVTREQYCSTVFSTVVYCTYVQYTPVQS